MKMEHEITGQLGRSSLAPSKPSSGSQLPGTIRKKYPGTGYSGTGSIFKALTGRDPGSVWWSASPEKSAGTLGSQNKAGVLTGTITQKLSDSEPISTNKAKDSTAGKVPASYDTGNLWSSVKSGLTTYMPAILVIGSVILGIIIIKSAGSSGGRKR